ncbi:MAG: acetyl-CoA carboxylase, carboxyltransferase subunit beta [Alphaproteobacteria bacterium]
MNWLSNFIRPKINSFTQQQKEVPDNLWQKCPACEGMLFHRDLEESMKVCYHCGHHLRISVKERLKIMFDKGEYSLINLPPVALDPLKFKDRKKYTDRLKESQNKTGLKDAITLAKGKIGGQKVVIAAFNFSFMGGSMGMAVGEGIVKGAEEAVKEKAAFIAIPSSGGARMQEGMLSLVQMPRSIIAVEMVKDAKLPYIVLLTDPTTGGVSASFAMVGDFHLAEPGSTIGFAGRRVIEETVRETLPDDFQTAEYLLEHGIVDMVVPRGELHDTLSKLLNLVMNRNAGSKGATRTSNDEGNTKSQPKNVDDKSSDSSSTNKKAA